MLCERCGERYSRDDKHATNDYCGTCVFINGSNPTERFVTHPYAANEKKVRREVNLPSPLRRLTSIRKSRLLQRCSVSA